MNQKIHALAFFKNTKFKTSALMHTSSKYPFYQIFELQVWLWIKYIHSHKYSFLFIKKNVKNEYIIFVKFLNKK